LSFIFSRSLFLFFWETKIPREVTRRDTVSSGSIKKKFHERLRIARFTRSPNDESLLHVAHIAKGAGITLRDNIMARSKWEPNSKLIRYSFLYSSLLNYRNRTLTFWCTQIFYPRKKIVHRLFWSFSYIQKRTTRERTSNGAVEIY